ncbi:sugar porter family MFS transporter [Maribellus comscasis]|uniref:Sugar porter family MFS transporter n=1 Tax=Maribellus comscasis TaxID=2681766 RepID=A0A6I6K1Z2_9BACT|nr:sugar porter family MFS transporter [Maribellus comscasis]QGY46497.1 sugar porter family MFS transporter [Maribellus comscasis]
MKRYLYFITFVAALGSLLFGFETGVINGTIFYVAQYFGLSPAMKGFVVSAALIGCIIGALFIGKPADIYGRRFILKYMALFFLVSMLMTGLATHLWIFIIGRFIGGIAVGGASVVTPMYISEVAPPKYRGRLVATAQFAIVLGILVSFFSNFIIDSIGETENKWRWMFLFGVIPSAIFFGLLFFIQRSPRWLVKTGRLEEAKNAILRVNNNQITPDELVKEIQDSLDNEVFTHYSVLFKKPYLKLVLIGIGVGMFNQLSGINIVNYYSTDIFREAGFSGESAFTQTVLVGITNLVFTIVGMSLIDKFGRKFLLYIGGICMPIFLGLFSWAYISGNTSGYILLISMLGFIAFFAASQGTVIWVILSEMFPTNIRARGSAIGSFSHWFFNALNSWVFPVVVASVGTGYAFLFFGIATVLSLVFYRFSLVETKGKSLEEIEHMVLVKKS